MHHIRQQLFGINKPPDGYLILEKGQAGNLLFDDNNKPIGRLPFEVHLEDFRIEYYPTKTDQPWRFIVRAIIDDSAKPPTFRGAVADWESGKRHVLPLCDIQMEVISYDWVSRGESVLPEATVRLTRNDQNFETVFAPSVDTSPLRLLLANLYDSDAQWVQAGAPVLYFYPPPRMEKSYKSRVVARINGKTIAHQTIEVNRPLHIFGYHIYQHGYDLRGAGQVTILRAVSDSGLIPTYAGFVMLVTGMAWHIFRPRRNAATPLEREPAL
jgi:hypothetical protein